MPAMLSIMRGKVSGVHLQSVLGEGLHCPYFHVRDVLAALTLAPLHLSLRADYRVGASVALSKS